jgi:hypothetical protein
MYLNKDSLLTSVSTASLVNGNTLFWNGTNWTNSSFSGDFTTTNAGVATLATVNSNTGSFGSGTSVPILTVNAKGQVTAVSSSSITPAGIGAVATTAVGAANGVASLDSGGKVPTAQLPESVLGAMSYQGTWNATTNSPSIPSAASGNKGYYYKVSVAGTTSVDGTTDWQVGDWIVSNGTSWDKIDNSELVTSVFGRTGAITAQTGDYTVSQITGAAPLASPTFTGTVTLPTGTVGVTQTAGNNSTSISTTAYVDTGLALKANLASPTFTGTPTLPTGTIAVTQSSGDNTTAIATTAFVKSQNYITSAGAPVQSVAGRTGAVTLAVADVSDAAPLASPALTGTPTAPTASANTNNTQIATTAYTDAAVSALDYTKAKSVSVITAVGAVTVTTGMNIVILNKTSGAATTVNLPSGSSSGTGKMFVVKDGKGDAATNNITVTPNGGDTIDGGSTYVLNTNYEAATFIWNGTQWNII